jgi:aspartate ammonia-lyase
MTTGGETRVERDGLGEVEVPADVLWGVHTARAIANYGTDGVTLRNRPRLLEALVAVKIAAAGANMEHGALDAATGEAIVEAGREVLAGEWHDQFPINLVQGGGGTATNMNVNEVLANRAAELMGGTRGTYDRVHPNDHVNRSQSTNDVFPTGMQVATMTAGAGTLRDFDHLASTFAERARGYAGIERLARTCLQDALPIGIDATHASQARAVERTAGELRGALDALASVPLGATAVGSGAGAPDGYRERSVALLAEETGLDLVPAPDGYDALAHLDPLLSVASALNRVMLVIAQTAQDLRFLSSGPRGGIGEVTLPAVQVGSSMMPGKVNPVVPEYVMQVSYETRGAHHVIEAAVAAGELELNIMEPVIAKHLLTALEDGGRAARRFADLCIAGLQWNVEATAANLRGSLMDAVSHAAEAGWEAATATRDGRTGDVPDGPGHGG